MPFDVGQFHIEGVPCRGRSIDVRWDLRRDIRYGLTGRSALGLPRAAVRKSGSEIDFAVLGSDGPTVLWWCSTEFMC